MTANQNFRKILNRSWPYLFLAAFCFVAFYRVFLTHQATFFINPDNVDQFYSWYQKLASSIHHGYLPLWDASTLSGHSFVGEFQQGVFYPLNILFCWLFGSQNGIPIMPLEYLVGLHFFIASLGMYLFCRAIKLSSIAGVLAGIIYAYSSLLGTRSVSQTCIFFGLSLIPLAVFFAQKYIDTKRYWFIFFTGLVLGLIILAGHIQPFLHGLMIIVLLFAIDVFKKPGEAAKRLKKYLIGLTLICVSAILIALPQVVLALQYMKNAYRFVGYPVGPGEKISYSIYSKLFSMEPHEIFNLINPWQYPIKDGNELFIGLSALIVILVGVFALRAMLRSYSLWKENKAFVLILITFGLLAAIGYHTFFAVLLYKTPIIYQIRQLARYVILIQFGLITFFAIIFSLLSRPETTLVRKVRSILFIIGSLALVNSAYIILLRKHIFNGNYGLQWFLAGLTLISIALFIDKKSRLVPVLACIIAVNTLLGIRIWLVNPGPQNYTYKNVESNSIIDYLQRDPWSYRVASLNDALPPNIANVHPFQTTFGYGATKYKPYFDYISSSNPTSDKTYDLLGTKYLATKQPLRDLPLVMKDDVAGIYLYERVDYYPKIFTSDDVANGASGKTIAALNRFKIKEYGDMKQAYEINLPKDSTVIFSEINYPGWKAYVDGQQVDIKTAELRGTSPLFKSIQVPAGAHEIRLKYLF